MSEKQDENHAAATVTNFVDVLRDAVAGFTDAIDRQGKTVDKLIEYIDKDREQRGHEREQWDRLRADILKTLASAVSTALPGLLETFTPKKSSGLE